MSTAQHTPGPWYWHVTPQSVSLRTPDRGQLVVMDLVRKGMQSAEPRFSIWEGKSSGAPRERKGGILEPGVDHPDAHLIAAAPDLLEQLNNAMRLAATLEDLLKDNGLDVSAEQAGWDAQHQKFRDTISKALGRIQP